MKKHEALPTSRLQPQAESLHPDVLPELVYIDDPARDVLIDFVYLKPPFVSPKTPVDEALTDMKHREIYVMIVADEEHKALGLVSTEDLLGEKPIKIMQQRRLSREEVTVDMVMSPQEQLLAISYDDIRHASVGSVINTLKEHQAHYAVVTKTEGGQQRIRGLLSETRISKQIHQDISSIPTDAHSLLELKERHS